MKEKERKKKGKEGKGEEGKRPNAGIEPVTSYSEAVTIPSSYHFRVYLQITSGQISQLSLFHSETQGFWSTLKVILSNLTVKTQASQVTRFGRETHDFAPLSRLTSYFSRQQPVLQLLNTSCCS